MFLTKIKTAAVALATVALLAVGGLVAASSLRPAPERPKAAEAPPARAEEKPPEKKPEDKKPEEKKPEKKADEKKPAEPGVLVRTTLTIDRSRGLPLVLSPDGKMLAMPAYLVTQWGVKLLDVKDGSVIKTLEINVRDMLSARLVFSPDGKRLSVAEAAHGAETWDVEGGKRIGSVAWPMPMPDPDTGKSTGPIVTAVALSANGKLAATLSDDGKARVYSLETGKLVSAVAVGRMLRTLALSADGKWLAAMAGGQPKLWEAQTGKEGKGKAIEGVGKISEAVSELRFSGDGKALIGITTVGVKTWRLDGGKEGAFVKQVIPTPQAVAITADGKMLVIGTSREKLALYDTTTGKRLMQLHWVSDPSAVAITGDGKTLLSKRDDRIRVWDLTEPKKD
jgi:WD40 repeat protein